MIDCWPPCSPFCECIDGDCRPSKVQINAMRLKMADGRYLVAAGGGGAELRAFTAGPEPWRTFLFAPPAEWPFASGDAIALAVCDDKYDASANLVRVYHTRIDIQSGSGARSGVSYVLGGVDGAVWVNTGFSAGYPGYGGSDPLETEFSIVKPSGGAISHGDTVFIRVAQSYTTIGPFFFRVTASGSVVGDGSGPPEAATATATPFIVEFLQVKGSGVGPRPTRVLCRRCATVSVTVRDARSQRLLPGASVKASGSLENKPFALTARVSNDNTYVFAYRSRLGVREVCVPEGEILLSVDEERHESYSGLVTVPAAGSTSFVIDLVCTNVSGKVVDDSGMPVPDAVVFLTDDAGAIMQRAVNPADGSFTFECVKHGRVTLWTDGADELPLSVPAQGNRGAVLTIHTKCGDIEGHARDMQDGLPIPDVKLTVVGRPANTAFTDVNGHYRIVCVAPSGRYLVHAGKPGYQQLPRPPASLPDTVVPASGTVIQDIQMRRTPMLSIWNTGVDAGKVPLMAGDSDPHWFVVGGPGITTAQKAIVIASPPGLYYQASDSRWIWVAASGLGAGPGDLFTFQLQFDLTGFDETLVVVEGEWGVDNNGRIMLNGAAPVGTGTFSLPGDPVSNFNSQHSFTIDRGFVAGVNRLEVQVANVGPLSVMNPAGLNVTRLRIAERPL